MKDWLKKKSPKGPKGLKRWQWRWCRLYGGSLFYWKDSQEHDPDVFTPQYQEPLGAIPLGRVKECKQNGKNPLRFSLIMEGTRTFAFQAPDERAANLWMDALESAVRDIRSRGGVDPLTEEQKTVKYWKPEEWRQSQLLDGFLADEAKMHKEDQEKKKKAGGRNMDLLEAVDDKFTRTRRAPLDIRVTNKTERVIYVGPYKKMRFHEPDVSYTLALIDGPNSIIKVEPRESADAPYNTSSISVATEYVENPEIAVKLVFTTNLADLKKEITRKDYKEHVRHSASSEEPIWILPVPPPFPKCSVCGAFIKTAPGSNPEGSLAQHQADQCQSLKLDPELAFKFVANTVQETATDFELGKKYFVNSKPALDVSLAVMDYKKATNVQGGFLVSPYDWKFTVLKYPFLVAGAGAASPLNDMLIPAPVSRSLAFITEVEYQNKEKALQAAEEHLRGVKAKKAPAGAAAAAATPDKPIPIADETGDIVPSMARGPSQWQLIHQDIKQKRPTASKLISVVCLGDMMVMDREVPPKAHPVLRRMFGAADLILINMEAVVRHVKREHKAGFKYTPTLAFPMALEFVVEALASMNIDPKRTIFSMANNHAGDFGEPEIHKARLKIESIGGTVVGVSSNLRDDGTKQNRGLLTKVRIPPCPHCVSERGADKRAATDSCNHENVGGMVVGIVSWTRWMNKNSIHNTLSVFRQEDVLDKDWRLIKAEEKVDYLIGYVHWDYEQSFIASRESTELSRRLLHFGLFDAIVGHGPHVLQGVEIFDEYTRRQAQDTQREALRGVTGICAYSLGNVCSERGKWQTKMGGALELVLDPDRQFEQLYAYKIVPFIQKFGFDDDRDDHSDEWQMTLTPVDCLDEKNRIWDAFRDRLDNLFEAPLGVLRKFLRFPAAYRIRTWTSSQERSGTTTPVYLTAMGFLGSTQEEKDEKMISSHEKGRVPEGYHGRRVVSQEWHLRNEHKHSNHFNTGALDTFYVGSDRPLGQLRAIRICLKSQAESGLQPSTGQKLIENMTPDKIDQWRVERISILSLNDGEEYIFEGPVVVGHKPAILERYMKSALAKRIPPELTPSPIWAFNKVAKTMRTGDLIAFQSTAWYSQVTQIVTKSPYTHVAMVVRMNSRVVEKLGAKHDPLIKQMEREKIARREALKSLELKREESSDVHQAHQNVSADAATVAIAVTEQRERRKKERAERRVRRRERRARAEKALHEGKTEHERLADADLSDDATDSDTDSEDELHPDLGSDQILLYESTKNGDRTPDVTSGYNNYTGVHAFEARTRITSYKGKVFYIPLHKELDKEGERKMRKWITDQHRNKTPFDYFQMFGAGFDLLDKFGCENKQDLAELFCSEFVTAALQYAGLMQDKNASEQTPVDVVKFPCYDLSRRVELKLFAEKRGLPIMKTV